MVTKEGDGYFGELSQRQETILAKFKEAVNTRNYESYKYDLSQFDDYDYLRFLRSRKFDMKKTIEMFMKCIKWRIDTDVDHVLVSCLNYYTGEQYDRPSNILSEKP